MKRLLGALVLCATLAGGFALATPEVARADGPDNCIRVLASFFARDAVPGLRQELSGTRLIAAAAGVPTGVVIMRLAHRSGDVPTCFGFLLNAGND